MLEREDFYTRQEKIFLGKLNSPQKIQDFLNTIAFNFEKRGDTCYSPRFVLQEKTAHCMEGAMFAAAALEFHGAKPLVLDLRAVEHDFDHVVAVFKKDRYFGAISKTNHAVLRYREPIYKNIRELAISYFHEYFDNTGRKNLREYSELLDLRYFDPTSSRKAGLRRATVFSPPYQACLSGRQGGGRGGKNNISLPLVGRVREGLNKTLYRTRPLSLNPSPASGEGKAIVNWRIASENLFYIPEYLDAIKHYQLVSNKQIKNLRKADKIEIETGKIVEYLPKI